MDPLDPAASLEALAALPLELRPQELLRLADELERRLDAAVTPPARPGTPLEHPPGRP